MVLLPVGAAAVGWLAAGRATPRYRATAVWQETAVRRDPVLEIYFADRGQDFYAPMVTEETLRAAIPATEQTAHPAVAPWVTVASGSPPGEWWATAEAADSAAAAALANRFGELFNAQHAAAVAQRTADLRAALPPAAVLEALAAADAERLPALVLAEPAQQPSRPLRPNPLGRAVLWGVGGLLAALLGSSYPIAFGLLGLRAGRRDVVSRL